LLEVGGIVAALGATSSMAARLTVASKPIDDMAGLFLAARPRLVGSRSLRD
jgi:hypothetical protein